jgi:acetaldehyde dehydrogenase
MSGKLRVGILGTGNIGTDLLIKIQRSPLLECVIFVGRNLNSMGMRKALELGVNISDKSINAFLDSSLNVDLVFDATSAAQHVIHAEFFKEHNILAIDMTPSQVGKLCVPAINADECVGAENLNMITCGGQASLPIAYALKLAAPRISYLEVVSAVASKSAGPGTRANLDEYIKNTEAALIMFTGCSEVKAILNLNPAQPCIDMQTTIFATVDECNLDEVKRTVDLYVKKLQTYVPGYRVVVGPTFESGRLMVTVRVSGLGDYLPSYAGNLDIINCAAIAMAENYAEGVSSL